MIAVEHFEICGFGAIGAATARALVLHGRSAGDIWVIEADYSQYQQALKLGYRSVFGDACKLQRLRTVHVGAATEVVISVGDDRAADVTRQVRAIAPSALVKVAIHCGEREKEVLSAGASDVVVISKLAGIMLANSVSGG